MFHFNRYTQGIEATEAAALVILADNYMYIELSKNTSLST